jgi:hypothetical protein
MEINLVHNTFLIIKLIYYFHYITIGRKIQEAGQYNKRKRCTKNFRSEKYEIAKNYKNVIWKRMEFKGNAQFYKRKVNIC